MPGKEAELFDATRPWWYVIPVMRADVAGDAIGESFGIGKMAAEVGQIVRVVVIVAYRAVGFMVFLINIFEKEER